MSTLLFFLWVSILCLWTVGVFIFGFDTLGLFALFFGGVGVIWIWDRIRPRNYVKRF
jgi:hypothetical protein